jgi:DNA polymerase-3 subunit delta'
MLQQLDKDGAVDRDNGELRTEQAASIIHDVALKPVEAQWRIFLIQDVHTANASFLNKILKTLEEPPAQAILLLTALDRASVLPTIASRCQTLELRPVDNATIENALCTRWQAPADQAALLAHLANGRMGWAADQLRFPERAQQRIDTLATLWRLAAADRVERLAFSEALAANRNNRQLFSMLEIWSLWWRDVLLAQSGCLDACANIDQSEEVKRFAEIIDREPVRAYLQTLRRIEGYLHHTVNTRLALDVLTLKLPKITQAPRAPAP